MDISENMAGRKRKVDVYKTLKDAIQFLDFKPGAAVMVLFFIKSSLLLLIITRLNPSKRSSKMFFFLFALHLKSKIV